MNVEVASLAASNIPPRGDERRTLALDLARNGAGGFVDSAERTFFLLIAIKVLAAGSWPKAIIASGVGFGYLFTPWIVQLVRNSQRPVTWAASRLLLAAAACSIFASVLKNEVTFMIGTTLGLAVYGSSVPLITAIYNRNYPEGRRGRYVSIGIFVRVGFMVALGLVLGDILKANLATNSDRVWRLVPLAAAVAYLVQAAFISRMPSGPLRLRADEPANEREAWKHRRELLRSDALLRNVLSAWMWMGMANLMMLPLRVEYITNPRYGIALDPLMITLLTTVVPGVVRLVLTIPFGWAFDRMPFFIMRITVNMMFAMSIVAFFIGTSRGGLFAGSILFGIAVAGGDVLWNLWTVKFAPPGRVADYMSLHTFFTGVRAVLAPMIGFFLITRVETKTMGWICAGLIVVSSMILVPQMLNELRTRR
jgi:MFS family permease